MSEKDLSLFLAKRVAGDAGDRGRSSDALIAAAALGRQVTRGDYPVDLADLGRCCEAFALAPWDLKKAMLSELGKFVAAMKEKYATQDAAKQRPPSSRGSDA